MTAAAETRRTDWVVNGDLTYRIWQRTDGFRWEQRHEWQNADGSIRMDEWIRGHRGWCIDAQPVALAA